jgi:hypothetical protein
MSSTDFRLLLQDNVLHRLPHLLLRRPTFIYVTTTIFMNAEFRPYSVTTSFAEQASRIFGLMMGDQAELKSAGRVARLLEEQFIIDGWLKGRSYGFEAEIAQRYGVGRAAAREAVRILEARGVARMRRGRYGGLELPQPPPEVLYSGIGTYCYLHGVTRAQAHAARQLLDRVMGYLAAEQGREGGLRMLADQPLPMEQKVREARQHLRTVVNNAVLDIFSACLDHIDGMDLPDAS